MKLDLVQKWYRQIAVQLQCLSPETSNFFNYDYYTNITVADYCFLSNIFLKKDEEMKE